MGETKNFPALFNGWDPSNVPLANIPTLRDLIDSSRLLTPEDTEDLSMFYRLLLEPDTGKGFTANSWTLRALLIVQLLLCLYGFIPRRGRKYYPIFFRNQTHLRPSQTLAIGICSSLAYVGLLISLFLSSHNKFWTRPGAFEMLGACFGPLYVLIFLMTWSRAYSVWVVDFSSDPSSSSCVSKRRRNGLEREGTWRTDISRSTSHPPSHPQDASTRNSSRSRSLPKGTRTTCAKIFNVLIPMFGVYLLLSMTLGFAIPCANSLRGVRSGHGSILAVLDRASSPSLRALTDEEVGSVQRASEELRKAMMELQDVLDGIILGVGVFSFVVTSTFVGFTYRLNTIMNSRHKRLIASLERLESIQVLLASDDAPVSTRNDVSIPSKAHLKPNSPVQTPSTSLPLLQKQQIFSDASTEAPSSEPVGSSCNTDPTSNRDCGYFVTHKRARRSSLASTPINITLRTPPPDPTLRHESSLASIQSDSTKRPSWEGPSPPPSLLPPPASLTKSNTQESLSTTSKSHLVGTDSPCASTIPRHEQRSRMPLQIAPSLSQTPEYESEDVFEDSPADPMELELQRDDYFFDETSLHARHAVAAAYLRNKLRRFEQTRTSFRVLTVVATLSSSLQASLCLYWEIGGAHSTTTKTIVTVLYPLTIWSWIPTGLGGSCLFAYLSRRYIEPVERPSIQALKTPTALPSRSAEYRNSHASYEANQADRPSPSPRPSRFQFGKDFSSPTAAAEDLGADGLRVNSKTTRSRSLPVLQVPPSARVVRRMSEMDLDLEMAGTSGLSHAELDL